MVRSGGLIERGNSECGCRTRQAGMGARSAEGTCRGFEGEQDLMDTILVTGDVVLDCHLYGGARTAGSSFGGQGTVYTEHLGGAALTRELVQAAADAALQTKLETSTSYETHEGLVTKNLERTLPWHLRSYGVWVERPARQGSKDRVWRAQSDFGYGPVEPPRQVVFERNPAQPASPPLLTLIDDGGILFRHSATQGAWPEFPKKGGGHFLLKTTSPLCRGDLWAALQPVMDRLIVVVSADDLRREDAQIDSRLSWEQCVEHTIYALEGDPILGDLRRASRVVVSFGSAGALWVERGAARPDPTYHLVFDPKTLQGDHSLAIDGTVYGFQTCLAAGIAHHLMQRSGDADGGETVSPFSDDAAFDAAMRDGIAAGLLARRNLLELGHGPVDKPKPGFPVEALGRIIATSPGGFVHIEVPSEPRAESCSSWTILGQSEVSSTSSSAAPTPLTGPAQLAGRFGFEALSHVPALRIGSLFTVDRSEIESFRTLDGLIRAYEGTKVQKTPLSIGVFGPPGAGKSFGVKALAKGILGKDVPFLEFNLSQFKSPDELIGAFHRVRDEVLRGTTPVAFWDEFDSQDYKWLQYLLAPMQDGAFQDGQITHPIGKCVFIFAGGTASAISEFGAVPPEGLSEKELAGLHEAGRARRVAEQAERFNEFKLLKGPDFISRLHGFLNVLGPNPRVTPDCPDVTWPVRRAIILRGILGLKDGDELDMDAGLLDALLGVSVYRHGARSFEKIIRTVVNGSRGRLNRSALPPESLLDRETNAAEFHMLLTRRDAFKNYPDLEDLAAAVHYNFLDAAERSRVKAEAKKSPSLAWTIDPSIKKGYVDLSEDAKASNRAAARRIPDHLVLIGHLVELQKARDDGLWKARLAEAIDRHVERLARAEHLGWCAERVANGWTYGEARDNEAKHHPLIVPWAQLSPADQEKDRAFVRTIPELLEIAKFKAVPAGAPRTDDRG